MAELFYRRLMTVADDYGRYHASPATLRGACWPTCPDKVTEKQVAQWLSECCSGDCQLISMYESMGCRYLQISNFGQQTRGKSKFPEPPPFDTCLASDNQKLNLVGVGVVVGVEDEVVVGVGVVAPKAVALKRSAVHGTRLEIREPTDEMRAFAVNEIGWSEAKMKSVWVEFRDYWIGVAGQKGWKADWLATWRNRCREVQSRASGAGSLFPAHVPDRIVRRNENDLLMNLYEDKNGPT